MRNPLSRFSTTKSSSSSTSSISKKRTEQLQGHIVPPPTVADMDNHIRAGRASGGDKRGDILETMTSANVDCGPDLEILENIKINQVMLLKVPNFNETMPEIAANVTNRRHKLSDVLGYDVGYDWYLDQDNVVLADVVRSNASSDSLRAYVRAGPRQLLYHDPAKVVAGIVTCGGLCPGLNNVIRETYHSLTELYGVSKVYGFRGGYGGIYNLEPMELNKDVLRDAHNQGGTILSSSRGGFDAERILDKLDQLGVNQLYCIGGDGTMRGAFKLHQMAQERSIMRGRNCLVAVAGIPKTIDNDLIEIDRSFGFTTAVEEAVSAIRAAKVEAKCLVNGVGVVKLMGRSAGYIAAHASLASGDVDLCLIPEVDMVMEGPTSCLEHVKRIVLASGHAVVVVAEGAGEEVLGASVLTDESGNKKLPPIGQWFKKQIENYFKAQNPPIDGQVKFIDPSYMIRSVPANSYDATLCLLLSQNAVHGAMSGYSGFCVGMCNDRLCYLPMKYIVENSPRQMNPRGRTWERVIGLTQQP